MTGTTYITTTCIDCICKEDHFNYNLWQHSLCIENLTTEEFSFAYSAVLAITPVPVITIQ